MDAKLFEEQGIVDVEATLDWKLVGAVPTRERPCDLELHSW
jgi:hypothetical protein